MLLTMHHIASDNMHRIVYIASDNMHRLVQTREASEHMHHIVYITSDHMHHITSDHMHHIASDHMDRFVIRLIRFVQQHRTICIGLLSD